MRFKKIFILLKVCMRLSAKYETYIVEIFFNRTRAYIRVTRIMCTGENENMSTHIFTRSYKSASGSK